MSFKQASAQTAANPKTTDSVIVESFIRTQDLSYKYSCFAEVLELYNYEALTVPRLSIMSCLLGKTIIKGKEVACGGLLNLTEGLDSFFFILAVCVYAAKALLTSLLEKGQPLTYSVPFPPAHQGLWLSLQCIVGKCRMLPSARLKVTIRPAFLVTYCFVNFLGQVQTVCSESVTNIS